VATIHGHTLTRQLEDPFLSRLARWALRRFDELVAVSVEIARGLDTVDHPRVTMLPAYLPSPGRFAEAPTGALPKSGPTLVASAYRIAPAREGDGDVYGLDRAVEVFLGVARSQPRLSLAIFVAKPIRGRWPRRYVKSLVDRARAAGAGERVAVHVGEDLGPAWTRDGVVYLRPTRSDGDAVSVREALAAGRAVIASDAVIRPEGAKTVPGDDVEAWCKAVEQALTGDEAAAGPRAGCSHAETMLDFYARHLAGSGIDAR
jgi:glycosyltransferase involved in cell wall biosynthesis